MEPHMISKLGLLRLGASLARKGWLEKNDVINTLSLPALREALKLKRGKLAGGRLD